MLSVYECENPFYFFQCSLPTPNKYYFGSVKVCWIKQDLLGNENPVIIYPGVKHEGDRWGIESEYFHEECYGTMVQSHLNPHVEWKYVALEGSGRAQRSSRVPIYTYEYYINGESGKTAVATADTLVSTRLGLGTTVIYHPNLKGEVKYIIRYDVRSHLLEIEMTYNGVSFHYTIGASKSEFATDDPVYSRNPISYGRIRKIVCSNEEMKPFSPISISYIRNIMNEYADKNGLDVWQDLDVQCIDKIAERLQQVDCNLIAYMKDFLSINELFKPFINLVSNKHSVKSILNESASAYLSYHYGISLTVRDTIDIGNTFVPTTEEIPVADISYDAYQHAVLGGFQGTYNDFNACMSDFKDVYARSGNDPLSFIAGLLYSSIGRHQIYPDYSYSARKSTDYRSCTFTTARKSYFHALTHNHMDQIIQQCCKSYDLWLSKENMWDMVPFSFVIDWFLTTDDCVEFEESYDLYETFYHHKSLVSNRVLTDVDTPQGSYTYTYYNRFLSDVVPHYCKDLHVDCSTDSLSKHGLEGTALIVQTQIKP